MQKVNGINKSRFVGTYILLFSIVVMGVFASLNSDNLIYLILSFVVMNIYIGIDKLKNRGTYLLFNITFFTFLLGNLLIKRINGESAMDGYSSSTVSRMYLYIILALVGLTIGQLLYEKLDRHRLMTEDRTLPQSAEDYLALNNRAIFCTKALFLITFPFSLLDMLDKATYVIGNSYLAYYTSYVSSIPYIFIKIGSMNRLFFALFLCLEFRRNKIILPTALYFSVSVLSLFMGQRNIFVLDILMLGVLIVFANKKSIKYLNKPMYTKKTKIILCISAPIVVALLGYWNYARVGASGTHGIFESFKDFFLKQGEQINFFANTIEYKDKIWSQEVPYTFAAPYNYIRQLFGLIDYGIYTEENALYGNSLAATQFYITSPGSLVAGKGSGCCYLSELYYDFGTIGIIIGSIFIGYICGALSLRENKSFYVNAMATLMIRNLIYIPRASYFDWIATPFNIWNIFGMALVMVVVSKGRIKSFGYIEKKRLKC